MLVHNHEFGTDTVLFEAPDSLARDLFVADDESAAMVALCHLLGVDHHPEDCETAEVVAMPIRDSKVVISQLELDGLAASVSIA